MALRKMEKPDRFTGFLELVEGNRIEGVLQEERITGETDDGKERGYLVFKVTVAGTICALDKTPFEAKEGDLIAVSITNATRVLCGASGKLAALTFTGFGKAKPGQKPYHEFQVELDDSTAN